MGTWQHGITLTHWSQAMFAVRHDNEIHMSNNISTALAGVTSGYLVEMHDPVIRCKLRVDADSCDDAHRAAIALCKREAIGFKLTGATIQRIQD